MSDNSLRRQFARDILGPIFLAYCHRLWLFQMGTGDTAIVALFAARGGLRLLTLYQRFLATRGLAAPVPCHQFMVSRLAAAKGCYRRAPEAVSREVIRIFHADTIDTLARALIPPGTDPFVALKLEELPRESMRIPVTRTSFEALVNSGSEYGQWLRRHLEEQGDLLQDYLAELTGTSRRILLCDTGLYGCTQAMLSEAHPHFDWTGVYFGKANYTGMFAPHHWKAFGLVFDRDQPSLFVPATSLLRYWHICEMPMEPPVPSVAVYFRGHDGKVRSNLDAGSLESIATKPENPYFDGICDYFDERGGALSALEINRLFMSAARQLQRRIYMPAASDVRAMTVGSRSPDFGRPGAVPTIVEVSPATATARKIALVKEALWQEGQTRLIFPTFGALINMARWCLRLVADVARLPFALFGR